LFPHPLRKKPILLNGLEMNKKEEQSYELQFSSLGNLHKQSPEIDKIL